ncbi:MAG: hypothetical protein NT099_04230 [Candidatus Saganbacteria bacterium]|nr:hypothetical protein [Candidatus Saganbacteria bacterium]
MQITINRKNVSIITVVVVALFTYLPTIAEILFPRHVTLFHFFIPFFEFPNFGANGGFSPIVYILAVPFALLKGCVWGLVMYLLGFLGTKYIKNRTARLWTIALVFILVFIKFEAIGAVLITFMFLAAMAGF